MQTEDPGALPDPGRRLAGPHPLSSKLDDHEAIRQIAGGLSALARRVDQLSEQFAGGPRSIVTLADRQEALRTAREIITELGMPPSAERVHSELAVARYLTGE